MKCTILKSAFQHHSQIFSKRYDVSAHIYLNLI